MKTLVRILLLVLPILVVAVGAQAQQCSAQRLVGKYVLICDGYLSNPAYPDVVPSKLLGIATIDQSGKISATSVINLKGTSAPAIYNTYKHAPMRVYPNCTASATLQQVIDGTPYFDVNLTMVISHDGDTLDMLETDQGTVFSCKATRIVAVKNQP